MSRLRRWWTDVVVMAIYALMTVVMTWPLVLRLNSHFAGANIDVWINPWVTWWTEKALSEGLNLYHTDWMFYPRGVSLAFHSFSHVNTVLALLLRPWLGDLGAYNVTILLAHVLSGYAMFCLVRYIAQGSACRPTTGGTGCASSNRRTIEILGPFFSGLVFAFFPYRMMESSHPVIVSTQWMPLYFLFLLRLVREGRTSPLLAGGTEGGARTSPPLAGGTEGGARTSSLLAGGTEGGARTSPPLWGGLRGGRWHVLPAALFFVLTALSSWHLMVLTLLLSAVYLCTLFVAERALCSWATLGNLALLAGLTGAILAPFLYPLGREQWTAWRSSQLLRSSQLSRSYVGVPAGTGKGNDLIAFFLPAGTHPVLGPLAAPVHERINSRWPAYVGLTVIGLSIAGALGDWKRARFWILAALFSALCSLDPCLQVGGYALDELLSSYASVIFRSLGLWATRNAGDLGCSQLFCPTPWSVPVVWLFRHPFRFNVLLGLALGVTSGLGLRVLLAKRRSRWRWSLFAAAVAFLLFEYLCLPFPTTEAAVPDFYFDLSTRPGEGAILELPMGRQPAKKYLYYQTIHNRPLVEGVVSRTPPDAYAFIGATPALRSLRACGEHAVPPADLSSVLGGLGERGVDYVILHKDWRAGFPERSSFDQWLSVRAVMPDYEDGDMAVYNTQGDFLPDGSYPPSPAGSMQLLEACIGVRVLLHGPASVLPGDVLEIPLEWAAGRSPWEGYVLELALVDGGGEVAQRRRYEVMAGVSITTWPAGARHTVSYAFQVDPRLAPGLYHLRATLVPVACEGKSLLAASLLDVQVRGE